MSKLKKSEKWNKLEDNKNLNNIEISEEKIESEKTESEKIESEKTEEIVMDKPENKSSRRVSRVILKCLFWVFVVAMIIFMISLKFFIDSWASLTMEELVFHLTVPLDGFNSGMVWDYFKGYGIYEIIIIILLVVIFFVFKKFFKTRKRWFYIGTLILIFIAAIFTFKIFDEKMGVIDYVKASVIKSTFIEDNYVAPNSLEITFPEKKKNLIYIYLESMEVTYTSIENGGAFQQNIIPEFVDYSREGDDFSGDSPYINGAVSLYDTTWTMGAMFAESTGLPLKTSTFNANYITSQDAMYPSVIGIGNILKDHGYTNELLLGSSATFGGRELFYRTHGDYFIYDYNYVIDQGILPSDYHVFWGYEDLWLFEYAKREVERLSEEGEPFNLTMLTADSHFEDGYRCPLCGYDYYDGDQYSNVMACSSKQVHDFIEWLKEEGYYEDTIVVLSGDHPTMDSDFCLTVPEDYQRKVVVSFLNSQASEEDASKYREYSTFDLFPTTLAAMGADIPGNRLGMGVNLYSSEPTLVEKYGVDRCDEELQRKSEFMDNLSGIQINDKLIKNIASGATIEPVKEGNGIQVYFQAYNDFASMDGFEVLTARVWNGKDVDINTDENYTEIKLDGFKREAPAYIYYNTKELEGFDADNVTISIYLVSEDQTYYIKSYISE
ncbi:MAG: LTA synthase family protein [Eubacterium sp.]|nr:LTA synthase family protein [Eubacterium sp.]